MALDGEWVILTLILNFFLITFLINSFVSRELVHKILLGISI